MKILQRNMRLEQIANSKRNPGLNIPALLKGKPGPANFDVPGKILMGGCIEPVGNRKVRRRRIRADREDGCAENRRQRAEVQSTTKGGDDHNP